MEEEHQWSIYYKNAGPWWCGYDSHKMLVLEDFKGWLKYSEFLRLLDRYPLQCETKGGMVAMYHVKAIIITTSVEPSDWYEYDERRMFYREVERRTQRRVRIEMEHGTVPDEIVNELKALA